jgi:hypothetical protein
VSSVQLDFPWPWHQSQDWKLPHPHACGAYVAGPTVKTKVLVATRVNWGNLKTRIYHNYICIFVRGLKANGMQTHQSISSQPAAFDTGNLLHCKVCDARTTRQAEGSVENAR